MHDISNRLDLHDLRAAGRVLVPLCHMLPANVPAYHSKVYSREKLVFLWVFLVRLSAPYGRGKPPANSAARDH